MYFPNMWWRVSIFPDFALNSKQLTQAILYFWSLTFPSLLWLMPESALPKYWISKISLGIGLAISFPLTSKPLTIMHKSSIMDFKKCFKEKEIVVYSRKRIKLKHEGGVNIKKCESGNNISKQMNTWALLSNDLKMIFTMSH